ncbi:hypothetical protein [Salibacter halophilus]|uniref:Uncharacterized protein n=1 Tax=Salibacter halophilus TaxID=1803916 RepID=A0A6N6M641_9FLAO|nr:hypothetical protein [Salibacter halophilus]KAB1063485.1 hypothetical protein F3059_10485 [Salibacter halophilus]
MKKIIFLLLLTVAFSSIKAQIRLVKDIKNENVIDMQFDPILDSVLLEYCNNLENLDNKYLDLMRKTTEDSEFYYIILSEFSTSQKVFDESGSINNYSRYLANNTNRFINVGNKYYYPIIMEEDHRYCVFGHYSSDYAYFNVTGANHGDSFVFDIKKRRTIGFTSGYSDDIIPISELGIVGND